MSFALFLNPNLTLEQAISLHQKGVDDAMALLDKVNKDCAEIKDPKEREEYRRLVMPIVMQMFALSF